MTSNHPCEGRFIRPLDILFLRDNHLFGAAAGDASRTLMPPWPSVFAGALRSRMLADCGASIQELNAGVLPTPLNRVLGSPNDPGEFMLGEVTLAAASGRSVACYRPLPADLVVTGTDDELTIHTLRPQALPAGLVSSATDAQLPILRTAKTTKAETGYWLNADGWQAHLHGEALNAEKHLIHTKNLWRTETRLGIALDNAQGSAAEGKLYTSDAVALCPDIGFHVTVYGADGTLPIDGLLRLGGDGRGAAVRDVIPTTRAEPDWERIRNTGRFRVILTSPGIFPSGHCLPGLDAGGHWRAPGLAARLISQAVPRYQVISGWDMHKRAPKPALRCAPAGSVYWFESFTGDMDALRKLSETGLWDLGPDNSNRPRRAEGFNRVAIANA